MIYQTSSAAQTQKLAQKIAPKLKHGAVVALLGDLGSGKTTFAQGIAQGLGVKKHLISPTFILIREYPVPNSSGKLFHVDLYRLENIKHIEETGLGEIFANSASIVLIEWAEKYAKNLPKNTLFIKFRKIDNNLREIEIPDFLKI